MAYGYDRVESMRRMAFAVNSKATEGSMRERQVILQLILDGQAQSHREANYPYKNAAGGTGWFTAQS